MSQTKVAEKIETHVLFHNIFFLNHAVYNMEKQCSAEKAIDNNVEHAYCILDT